jgi:tetratricopeptide (TPR) repeat protein/class 3 adenylate cyclase
VTARRWSELQDLLAAALDRALSESDGFLDGACVGRPELRRELTELLAASERASPLDGSVATLLEPVPSDPVRPGMEILGHYQVLHRLGRGGMGVVYQARDLRLERTLALKFLPAHLSADAGAKARLRVEAQAAAVLDHPNICTIHEIGETSDGLLFIAMAYYPGETIEARLARGAMPPHEAITVAVQAAQGIAKAHEHGVVHRDIKPANLMVTTEGVLKILDFGIAKVPGVHRSVPGQRLGTVAYMSPEQVRGEPLDGRTDVWSLGLVLYEMLTGERRFPGRDRAQMQAILDYRSPPGRILPPALPEGLDRVLGRMLAENPADRYTAAAVLAELEALRDSRAELALPPEVLPGGEQRQVTILAAAVAEHDWLEAALGAPGWADQLKRLRATAEDVVRRHGGLINRFTDGTLEALFGVPVTHEDDPVRAARAALELNRRVAALGGAAAGRPPVRLRSGIHTGSAAVVPARDAAGPYRVTGPVARLAAELSGHAPPGDVWASPDCRRAIAGLFDTEELAPMASPAAGSEVLPFRVFDTSEPRTRLEAAQRAGLTTFTGRERELTALQLALDEAVTGHGRFVSVVGDAGMGKSRLLLEIRFALEHAGMGLLHGRCEPSETGATYLPFVETLREWVGASPGEGRAPNVTEVVGRLRELGPELEEFLPLYLHLLAMPSADHPVPRHLQREHFRLAMQEALAAFVTLVARQRPTALLLEDWQWADEASHGVLEQVAELVSGFPLLVVVTSRPGAARSRGSQDHHLTIPLDPLGAESSASMLRSILRVDAVPARLVDLIHEHSGGNPFFLEEITQTLLEGGELAVADGAVVLADSLETLRLPGTVQAVIRTRLDRLDLEAREVLRLASVVGREFTRGILERATNPARLPHALQTLKAAGIIQQVRVVPEPTYRFKHGLTQQAALGSLLDHQRKELHGRVGEAIEARHERGLDEYLGRLVEHFSRAERWPSAVHYALRAAARANDLSQFAESLEMLERTQSWLFRLPDDPERREVLIDILFRQERLCETLGLRGRQQRIIDELVALLEPSREPARLAEACLRQGDLNTLLRRFEEAEAALVRSLRLRDELGDAIGRRNTLRSLGLLRWHQGRDEEALACIEATLAIDRERGDLEAHVGDLANLGGVLKGMGYADRARATLEEALRLSAEADAGSDGRAGTDLAHKRAYILHNLANVHRELGDETTALEYLAQARTLTSDKRLPIQLSYHFTSTAHIYLRQGRIEESLTLYRDAVELTRRAQYAPGLAQALRFLGEVLAGLGRHDEALPPLVEAAGLFAQLHDPVTEAGLWTEVAALHEQAGDLQSAFTAWGKARALHDQASDPRHVLGALEGLARVARRFLPDASLALGYYGEALALAERLADGVASGRLRNAMGIIEWERGRYDEARVQYEAALRIYRELGLEGEAAVMLASLGVTLNAMGRRVEARKYLEEASALHRAAGDRPAEARALGALTDVLRRLGEPGRAVACGEAALRLRRACGDRVGEGWMLQRLALAHADVGAAASADECAEAAARIAEETGQLELAAACHELTRAFGR